MAQDHAERATRKSTPSVARARAKAPTRKKSAPKGTKKAKKTKAKKTTESAILQISQVGDLLGLVRAHQEALNHLGSRELWFRGHAKASWKLSPLIFRPEYAHCQEKRLALHFKRHAPIRYVDCPRTSATEEFDWLSLMQHYGLPTRLLDWSTSIEVAAYFAVSASDYKSNAAIWVLQGDQLTKNQTWASMYPARKTGQYHPDHLDVSSIARDGTPDVILPVIPTAVDLRMLLQQARFTIHGSRMPLEDHTLAGRFLAKITIPKRAREILRLNLKLLGRRRSELFPDLDSLSKELVNAERESHKTLLSMNA